MEVAEKAGANPRISSPAQQISGLILDTLLVLPVFGQDSGPDRYRQAECLAMSEPTEVAELIEYLARTTRLNAAEATRVVEHVLAFLNETPEHFVRRRHLALQAQGYSNSAIFAQLDIELERWRFRAARYSERQIRRMIYG
jgi:hypothetical protein